MRVNVTNVYEFHEPHAFCDNAKDYVNLFRKEDSLARRVVKFN